MAQVSIYVLVQPPRTVTLLQLSSVCVSMILDRTAWAIPVILSLNAPGFLIWARGRVISTPTLGTCLSYKDSLANARHQHRPHLFSHVLSPLGSLCLQLYTCVKLLRLESIDTFADTLCSFVVNRISQSHCTYLVHCVRPLFGPDSIAILDSLGPRDGFDEPAT